MANPLNLAVYTLCQAPKLWCGLAFPTGSLTNYAYYPLGIAEATRANMQDFAKYRENNNLRLNEESHEWAIDIPSVLFSVIFSAILGILGLRLAIGEEIEVTDDPLPSPNSVERIDVKFDFYEELKRDDLYPPSYNNSQ